MATPRFRVCAGLVLSSLVVQGCAAPAQRTSPGAYPSEAVVCGAGLRTVFSAEIAQNPAGSGSFVVISATQLPDGSVVLSYDPDAPGAGDAGNAGDTGTADKPRLVRVKTDGSVQPVRIPDVDGLPVPRDAQPLAVDAAGTLYLFDGTHSRVVAGTGNRWRSVVSVPYEATFGPPRAVLGNDGSLHLILTTAIVRVDGDRLTPVVGVSARNINDISFPEAAATGVPGPAAQATLPLLTGAVVAADGTMYVLSASTLFAVSPAGLMTVVLDASAAGTGNGPQIPPGPSPQGSRFTGVAIGRDGSLLIADSGQQRLLSLAGGSVTVLLDGVSRMEASGVTGSVPDTALLVERNGGEVLCAYDR